MRINVTLTDGAPLPKHAKAGDAGLDLTTRQTVEIAPQGTVMVSTGVAFEIPEGYYGAVVPRSGMASKRGLTIVNTPGTIDSNYRGVVMLPLYNAGHETIVVERGERVAQIIIKRHETVECVEVSELSETERGCGAFGSTGAR